MSIVIPEKVAGVERYRAHRRRPLRNYFVLTSQPELPLLASQSKKSNGVVLVVGRCYRSRWAEDTACQAY